MNIGDIIYTINNRQAIERDMWYHENIESKKPILKIDSPEFINLINFINKNPKYPIEKLIKFGKSRYKITNEVADKIINYKISASKNKWSK